LSLRDFFKATPEAVLKQSIQQVITSAGDGNLRDGSQCSVEFREYITKISSDKLSEYVRSCLEQSFKDSGLVLQDLVNEMGRRLGFDVEDGLYRGKPTAIGFDGIWRSKHGQDIIIEVKTTDYVTISLDKIATYRRKLISNQNVSQDASILIIVGREDTGAIEAQIRGSRYAWDIRLIGADRLDSLLQIMESSDDDNTVLQIQEILRPFEYTKVDRIIDVVFSAAKDTEPVEEAHDLLEVSEQIDESKTSTGSKKAYKQDRTDTDSLNRTRLAAVRGLGAKVHANFQRHRQTLFWTPDKARRVCAAVSKRYESLYKPYWYAYHPHWDTFLQEGAEGYFVLACMDRETAFAIPHSVVRSHLEYCSRTSREDGKSYWHIALSHSPQGGVVWDISKEKIKVSLTSFEFPLKYEALEAPELKLVIGAD
jgi:hypothetical protein